MTQAPQVFKSVRPGRRGSNPPRPRSPAMPQDHDASYNRDDQQKPGRPQRMAQEPAGAKGSARSPKVATDPASGEPQSKSPRPAQEGRRR